MSEGVYALEMLRGNRGFSAEQKGMCAALQLKNGRVHALLGDCGAGKSAVADALCGLHPEKGARIMLQGREKSLRSPAAARASGIALVRLRTQIAPSMTVMQHILLGAGRGVPGPMRRKKARRRIEALMEQYDLTVDLKARIGAVSAGMREEASVLRVLYRDSDIVVFDEPAADLTPQEADRMFRCMRKMAAAGKAVLFTTRKPEEAMSAADDCTVLRDGMLMKAVPVPETDAEALYRLMTGQDRQPLPEKKEIAAGSVVLEVRDASVRRGKRRGQPVKSVSLEARAGEILCVAGQRGSGLTTLADALAGVIPLSGGRIRLNGENITVLDALERAEEGVGYLPWRDHGLAAGLSMTENMMMKRTGDPAVQDSGWIRGRNARALTWQWLDHYRLSDADGPASSPRCMSRGQRQRAVLGREMDRGTQVLLATLPLTGLNETERRDMISLLMAVRESRRAVILFTTDAEEAMALGDRIVVLRGGEIVGEFHPEAASAREVGLYMTGDRRQGMEDYFDEE